MKTHRLWIGMAVLLLNCGIPCFLSAQTPCPGPPPMMGTAKGNIFTDAQEMDLGDAIAEQFEHNFHVVHDEQLNLYLDQIGQRLLAQMPPTHMKFRFVLVDIPTPNAFTLPGGRIYVTRKLVAFAQNEDELAGVLGHELGHALTHQPAAEMSRIFREVLDVKSVGDRSDIFLKYNQLIENIAKKQLHFNSGENQEEQTVADSYGLYAMSRAGYEPAALLEFFNRLAQTGGKTGNWLTDLFGTTTPNEQRLREIKKYIADLPGSCIAPHRVTNADNFRVWQEKVIAYSGEESLESLPGLLWTRQLSPPLESDITWVKFSPDGKYLLAQDDFNVYVLSRQPFHYLFRIPVEGAEPASFTPDSQSVLIWTHGLHIEKWSLVSRTRKDVHEVVVQNPCAQSELSSDGNEVACVQVDPKNDGVLNFRLLDADKGTTLIEKKDVYTLDFQDLVRIYLLALTKGKFDLMHMAFSPDGHYFAISRNDTAEAWDLRDHSPVKLNGNVKNMMSGGFVFIGPDRIVGINGYDPKKSGVEGFPSGPAGVRIPMGGVRIFAPSRGDVVMLRPAGDFAVDAVSTKTGDSEVASHFSALDVFDDLYARPQPDGTIGLFDISARQEVARTSLSGHMIGWLRAAEVSPDMRWLAGSGETHGGVWNLDTGQRAFDVRDFQRCGFSPDDTLVADFPAYMKEKRIIGLVDPVHKQARQVLEPGDQPVWELGKYLIYTKREKEKFGAPSDLEIHDAVTGKTLWRRHYAHTPPDVWMVPWGKEMALLSPLASDEAKERMKSDAAFAEQVKKIQSKDTATFVEVVDSQTGTTRGQIAVDTGKGSFQMLEAFADGQWVVIADNQNRVLVYSLDGHLVGRVFGTHPMPGDTTENIAVQSDDRTIDVYQTATLEREEELKFSMPLAYFQIVDHDTKLFALSEDQSAYLLDLTQTKHN